MLDIKGKELAVNDKILYATTHGNLQIGRILSMTDDGSMKVIGKTNKRELTIMDSTIQVFLLSKGYYDRVKKRRA
ncbi:hypothetical protein [Pseudomonas haemolytica]|jgi:hypothetical protein|uniref:Uncharacterized protein n=1 Tax=Pseudomonas haemolytica TaxID=2600065 RepID=A0ABS1H091_9PSED|nr:hypothetical protein [Pseudomonas haemolytica]MBK3462654.1 hypothetical protein [Pseudomonas haemolytica]